MLIKCSKLKTEYLHWTRHHCNDYSLKYGGNEIVKFSHSLPLQMFDNYRQKVGSSVTRKEPGN